MSNQGIEKILEDCRQIYKLHKPKLEQKFTNFNDFCFNLNRYTFQPMNEERYLIKGRRKERAVMSLNILERKINLNTKFLQDAKDKCYQMTGSIRYHLHLNYGILHECFHVLIAGLDPEHYIGNSKYTDIKEAAADFFTINYLKDYCRLALEKLKEKQEIDTLSDDEKKKLPLQQNWFKILKRCVVNGERLYLGGKFGRRSSFYFAKLSHIFKKNSYDGVMEALRNPEALRKQVV